VAVASAPAEAYARSLAPGFDAASSVALEGAATVDCSRGSARRVTFAPGLEAYDVEADGRALLVLRDTFARGWRATVDGAARPLVRANGKYRAVAVGPGRQRVELRYHPPGLGWGGALSGAAALLALWLLARPTAGGRSGALG
jgi:hypothetical protein